MKLLEAGQIVSTHGVRGELRVQPWCDSAEFLLDFETFYIHDESCTVESSRAHKNMLLLKLKGVDTVEQAQKLKNKVLFLDKSSVHLPEGRYFVQDLIGLEVHDEAQGCIGTLQEILNMPAHDVYVVKFEDAEHLIPAIPEFIMRIELTEGRIYVRMIEGM